MKKILSFILLINLLTFQNQISAQETVPVNYSEPTDLEIGGIKVTGAQHSDERALIAMSGLKVGDKIKIPGAKIQGALKALWNLRLFEDVQIYKASVEGEIVFLEIAVKEQMRLSGHSFKGVKKTFHDDLNGVLNTYLEKGTMLNETIKNNSKVAIEGFFENKGYKNTQVVINEIINKKLNTVQLEFEINQHQKVKIQEIIFSGNEVVKTEKLRRKMKGTKTMAALLSSSKLIEADFENDKKALIHYYQTLGYRDAKITKDSLWYTPEGNLMIHLFIEEGEPYYFGNISWKGNTIYEDALLNKVLGIKKGDIYNSELLETRLRFSEDGRDVTSIYMDNGYLFFRLETVELGMKENNIDLEIRIMEGAQATIDKVMIKGNDRTHEEVIRRELRTKPGQKFSRTDIIRSQRELVNMGYFNPETLGIETYVDPEDGTVDVEYVVEEKPSDQFELSGSWGGLDVGLVGSVGVTFNNFSLANLFNKEKTSTFPQGDGQKLSFRAQSDGNSYTAIGGSFTEPWLGGKKPSAFTLAYNYSQNTVGRNTDNFQKLQITSATIGHATRLDFLDDNIVSNTSLNFQNFKLNNWQQKSFEIGEDNFLTAGVYHNLNLKQTFSRSTLDHPFFPTQGSRISLIGQMTLPYSLFEKDKNIDPTPEEQFKWLEYYKGRLDAEWYTKVAGKLTLKLSGKVGMIGSYNKNIGLSPFERFVLGGGGAFGQQSSVLGHDIISLRGYDVEDLPGSDNGGAQIFNKFTAELRYPFSLGKGIPGYVLAFAEAGNSWKNINDYNPFDVKRSVGIGFRAQVPMLGLIGLDYSLGFDKDILNPTGNIFEKYGNFSLIFGIEPD